MLGLFWNTDPGHSKLLSKENEGASAGRVTSLNMHKPPLPDLYTPPTFVKPEHTLINFCFHFLVELGCGNHDTGDNLS